MSRNIFFSVSMGIYPGGNCGFLLYATCFLKVSYTSNKNEQKMMDSRKLSVVYIN